MGGVGSGHQGTARPLTTTAIRLDLRCEPFRSALSDAGAYIARWSRGRESVGGMILESRRVPDVGKPTVLVVPLTLLASPTWPVVEPKMHLQLVWSACPFGGHRAFVQCPHCSRRAVVLYLARGLWRCRRCAGVVHPSTRQDDYYRALAKLAGVRRAMGYSEWHGDGWTIPPQPGRLMRGTTWQRLVTEAKAAQMSLWLAYERSTVSYMSSLRRLLSR